MKKLLLLLLIGAVCAGYVVAQSGRKIARGTVPIAPVQPSANPEPETPQPKPAPAVLSFLPASMMEHRIRTLDNNHFRLADFQGKVLVINLWASWCGPCRREVPEYENVRKDYLGRDVEFIGLTTEDPAEAGERVNRFVRQTNFGFLLGWADRELARTLMNGRGAIPQTLVIDTQGNVVNHWVGYAPGHNGSRLREAIENALK
jgi:thiol-disulfide isomerase/thioredoxin